MQIDPTLPIQIVDPASAIRARQPAAPVKVQVRESQQPGKPAPQAGNTADPVQTGKAVHELGQEIGPFNVDLKFSKDSETGTIVIQMIDRKSGEELQQIPSQAMLHVSATLRKLQGKLFDGKA